MSGWVEGEPLGPGFYWIEVEGVERACPVHWLGRRVYCFGSGEPLVVKVVRHAPLGDPPPREDSTCPGSGPEPADRPKGEYPGLVRLEEIETRLDALEDTARWENKGTAQELEGRVASLESHRDWTMRAVADLLDRIKKEEDGRWLHDRRLKGLERKVLRVRDALRDETEPEQEDS